MEVELFQRSGRGLSLTPAGAALQDSVSKLLGAAAQLKARVTAAQAPGRLRLGVGSALADNWLVRRLPDFASRHPEVTLELMVVENEAPERRANLDVRILWVAASEARPTSTQRPLFREHVFPVCSPKLLPEGYQPGDPAILKKLPLLHKIVPGVASGAEWSWHTWFDLLGINAEPKEALRFTSIGPVVSAAIEGAGVGLVRSMVANDALRDGRLVRVLDPERDLLSAKIHVVRWPARLIGSPHVAAFESWICSMAHQPEEPFVGVSGSSSFHDRYQNGEPPPSEIAP